MEWTLNPLVAIGIGIAVMFFGYFFGLFEGRNQGYKKRKEEEKDQPLIVPPASPPASSDETPILNISADEAGKLHLKIDGQQTDSLGLTPEQRKRLIAILTQVRPWLEAPKATPSPAARKAAPPPTVPKPAPASRPIQAASTPSLSPSSSQAAHPSETEGDEEIAAPKSIVAQIDSVLQAQLAGTPLSEKGIRLQESLDGGVNVWIGVNRYEAVDDVPDEVIKAAIKGAIAEWESKYTPGL